MSELEKDNLPEQHEKLANYALAIDVGGTSMKIGVVSQTGQLIYKDSVPTPQTGPEDLITVLEEQFNRLFALVEAGEIKDSGTAITTNQLAKYVGVAVPGVVDERTGMALASANLGWRDFPMRARLAEKLKRPVILAHDVRSGALAEAKWGLGAENCLFVALGTGVSAGLVLAGELVSLGGYTGEIGQLLLTNPDLSVPEIAGAGQCGDSSCVDSKFMPSQAIEQLFSRRVRMERLCSAAAINDRYNWLIALKEGRELSSTERVGTKEIFARYWNNEPLAVHVVGTALDVLAVSLASAITTLGNLTVVLGGGLANEGPSLLQAVKERTATYLNIIPVSDFALAKLGSWAQCLGVGAQVFQTQISSVNN